MHAVTVHFVNTYLWKNKYILSDIYILLFQILGVNEVPLNRLSHQTSQQNCVRKGICRGLESQVVFLTETFIKKSNSKYSVIIKKCLRRMVFIRQL